MISTNKIEGNTIDMSKRPRICYCPTPGIPKINGTLLVCGMGETGQLGLGVDEMEKKYFTIIPTLEKLNIVDISAGGMHSVCLTSDGIVYTFGCNDEGALGRDTTMDNSEFLPNSVKLPGRAVKITAGDSHSSCLLENGLVFAWGSFRDSHGNMGLTVEGDKGLPIQILPNLNFGNIASGADHLVLLTTNGQLYTFGCAEQGQLGRTSLPREGTRHNRHCKDRLLGPEIIHSCKLKYVDAIWTTTYSTYVKRFDKQIIYGFGLNNYSQLGLKITGFRMETCTRPMETNFKNIKKICGGQHHSILLTNDNKCYAIGRKDYGRLGLGKNLKDDVIKLNEIPLLKNKNVIDINCGEVQSFAITDKGELYSWGMGSNLQLGTGNEDDAEEPILIVSKQIKNKKIFKVSSGGQHTMILIEKDEINNLKEIKIVPKIAESSKLINPSVEASNGIGIKENESNGIVLTASGSKDTVRRGRKRKLYSENY